MDGRHPSGGSLQLGELIDKHGQYLAADLMETYTVDIRDVLDADSGVTPRWLLVLIGGLGSKSRYAAELNGGQQFRGWDLDRCVSVYSLETLRAIQWLYTAAHVERKPQFPKPFPIPRDRRPKEKTPDKPGSFAFIAKSRLASVKKRKAEQ